MTFGVPGVENQVTALGQGQLSPAKGEEPSFLASFGQPHHAVKAMPVAQAGPGPTPGGHDLHKSLGLERPVQKGKGRVDV